MIIRLPPVSLRSCWLLSSQDKTLLSDFEDDRPNDLEFIRSTLEIGFCVFDYVKNLYIRGKQDSINVTASVRPTTLVELIEPLPVADRFYDNVVSLNTLEHNYHDRFFLSEILRVLRPGGRLVFTMPLMFKRLGKLRITYMLRIKRALRELLFLLNGQHFVTAFSLVNRLHWKLPIRLDYRESDRIYIVSDLQTADATLSSIAFWRKERVWVYKRGVQARMNDLGKVYLLSSCDIKADDTVIDCGANIGEFSALVQSRYGCNVISVEPEVEEARCIRYNVPSVRHVVNLALWSEVGEIKSYSKNKSADSSIFKTDNYDFVTTVNTLRIDDLFERYGLKTIKFLKLEAEGAEPEILIGAANSLPHIEYISADLGPERGLEQESTVVPVCNYLFARDFELVTVYPRRQVYLFRNKLHRAKA